MRGAAPRCNIGFNLCLYRRVLTRRNWDFSEFPREPASVPALSSEKWKACETRATL